MFEGISSETSIRNSKDFLLKSPEELLEILDKSMQKFLEESTKNCTWVYVQEFSKKFLDNSTEEFLEQYPEEFLSKNGIKNLRRKELTEKCSGNI